MRKRILSFGLVALVGTATIINPFTQNMAYANTGLEQKKENIKNERSDVDTDIKKKQSELSNLEDKQKVLDNEVMELDMEMTDTNEQIRELQSEMDETQQKIKELKLQIAELKERIKKRNAILKEKALALQESGGEVEYIEVLLGAKDFSDFVSRVSAVSTMAEADKEILKAHEEDKKTLEESETELNNELKNLETGLADLESLKQELEVQIAKKNKLINQVKERQQDTEASIYELEDEATFLKEQESAIQSEMDRQEQLEWAKKSTPTVTNKASSKPNFTSGNFMWPAKGTFTSGYGSRWGKLHAGIDLANPAANVPIVAAADGTVIRSYYSSSYGNVVFVSHNIEGKVYTTLYAHMESRLVSNGQSISKGQQIGYMGNTGRSTGKHLHFEIHDGAWKNPINPMKFLE
ncbi:murein hydrolase activator EnvC family protein [Peribacillus frigoritolerans]|uniref:murein hydrolase activator EnvC family protein n=1 Tax=Peribacillus frigoritolerans TaxID=450367 RepID=UPI00257AF9DC|nr:peptidoglycan DD-metalloendopeptidase family protein [Peribacillus frigoritolerans]